MSYVCVSVCSFIKDTTLRLQSIAFYCLNNIYIYIKVSENTLTKTCIYVPIMLRNLIVYNSKPFD